MPESAIVARVESFEIVTHCFELKAALTRPFESLS
jgi:hypothetical protein